MSLKELTMKQHHNAERQKFAGVLMSGKITKKVYMRYLMNQKFGDLYGKFLIVFGIWAFIAFIFGIGY